MGTQSSSGVATRPPSAAPLLSYVTTVEEIQQIVDVCRSYGAFVFDVETLGNVEDHPDMMDLLTAKVEAHVATLKYQSESVAQRVTEGFIDKATSSLGLDPNRNKVIWIGIATYGHSWAIPMGHPNGEVIEPEERGDGSTVPPEPLRAILKSGKTSKAKKPYFKPAVHGDPPEQLTPRQVFDALERLFFDPEVIKIGHNVKFDAKSITKYFAGNIPPGPYRDTMVVQHVLDENLPSFSLASLISEQFEGHNPYAEDGKLGSIIGHTSFSHACKYVHLDVIWTWLLYQKLMRTLAKSNEKFTPVMEQDSEVLEVLLHMEYAGIQVDQEGMERLGVELTNKLKQLKASIVSLSYPGFNPDSTSDKRAFLFGKKEDGGLALESCKQTASGKASVDKDSLAAISKKHKVVPMLIDWSATNKLKGTYVDGLLEQINEQRLYPQFHLHRTSTGRLASSQPNIQNIPQDSSVRGLFRASPGCHLLVADYDQIELRIMAMFSQDPKMMAMFIEDRDIHSGAAAGIYSKKADLVTSEERKVGKTVNFLTGFGGGAELLGEKTGVSKHKAQQFIDNYYKEFSELAKWKRRVVRQAQRDKYVTTIAGRRRRLPYINSKDNKSRSRAERQAVNSVVQGSASEICKKAMVKAHAVFKDSPARILVQVHDELVIDVPDTLDMDHVTELLLTAMGHGTVIRGVPLKVSADTAVNWSEAK